MYVAWKWQNAISAHMREGGEGENEQIRVVFKVEKG